MPAHRRVRNSPRRSFAPTVLCRRNVEHRGLAKGRWTQPAHLLTSFSICRTACCPASNPTSRSQPGPVFPLPYCPVVIVTLAGRCPRWFQRNGVAEIRRRVHAHALARFHGLGGYGAPLYGGVLSNPQYSREHIHITLLSILGACHQWSVGRVLINRQWPPGAGLSVCPVVSLGHRRS